MAKFCVHEQHGGVCKNTGTYCNLRNCPYEDLKEFTVIRHGHWDDECRCTACGWYGDDWYKRDAVRFSYCPNCGAKMDGE